MTSIEAGNELAGERWTMVATSIDGTDATAEAAIGKVAGAGNKDGEAKDAISE